MWDGAYSHTRTEQVIQGAIPSGGALTGALPIVPEGYCWYVERITAWSNGTMASTARLEIFVSQSETGPTSPDKTGRQDVAQGAVVGDSTSDENSPIYVGPGQNIVAQWTALTSGDKVSATFQIRVHELLRHRSGPRDRPVEGVVDPEKMAADGNPAADALQHTAALLADAIA